MVAIYFDRQFIERFQQRNDHDNPVIYDFLNHFIKKIRGVKVYVDLNTVEELQNKTQENEFYWIISEIGQLKLIKYNECINSIDFYKSGPITKIFFVERPEEDELQKKYGHFFISNNSLIDKWKVFTDREENEMLIKSNPRKDETGVFKGWKDLSLFKHVANNILLFDLYALTNKKDQRIDKNILPCLLELIRHNSIVDLTIITRQLPLNPKKQRDIQDLWIKDDFSIISEHIKPIVGSVKNFSLVKYEESKNIKADSEHNRYLITNYFFIRLEAGFNVFKDNGEVNNRDSIKIDSIFKNRVRNIVAEAIKNLKTYISSLKQMEERAIGPGKVVEHYFYHPYLKSRYLKDD